MKKLKMLLIALPISLLLMSSCKQKGCTDPDAVNYSSYAEKSDYSCKYAYLTKVSVSTSFGLTAPDLFVKFGRVSNTETWDEITEVVNNNYSANWSINDLKMKNEEWEYFVYDEDFTTNEIVFYGNFNPVTDLTGNNQVVQTRDNGTISFDFDVK